MARQEILTSDTLAAGTVKLNAMFAEIYASMGGGTTPTPAPGSYGPLTVIDTEPRETNSTSHIATFEFVPGVLVANWYVGMSEDGLSAALVLFQKNDGLIGLKYYDNGVLSGELGGGAFAFAPATGDVIGFRLNDDKTCDVMQNGDINRTYAAVFIGDRPVGTKARIEAFDGQASRKLKNARILGL